MIFMDAKVTLSFNATIIERAKKYAGKQGLSLSRLTEILLKKVISTGRHDNIEDIPISDWVSAVAEGEVEYRTRKRSKKSIKKDFFENQ